MKPYPLVLVEWQDASHESCWQEGLDVNTDPWMVQSIGFVMAKTKKVIVLAQSLASDNCAHLTQIPRGMIKKIHKLERKS